MADLDAAIATPVRETAPAAPSAVKPAPRAARSRRGQASGPEHTWHSPKVITSAASGSLLLLGWTIQLANGRPEWTAFCASAAIFSGAFYFGRKAISDLVNHRQVGFYFLMSAAAVVSAFIGHVQEGGILVFLTSISEAAQDFTEWKTRSAIHSLMNLAPKTAIVLRGDHAEEILVEDVAVGDLFLVKPGTAIATDGIVAEGTSDVNQASITGESQPVTKKPGDTVFAASINGPAALKVRATRTAADNTVARIIQMVEEAQEKKGISQRFIERFGARYSPIVVLAAILIAVLPPLLSGASWNECITRATVLMVAASPCAVMISIPVTLVAALGTGARKGVLIKGGVFLEQMAEVKVVAFHKTGTLTFGEPEVTDVILNRGRPEGSAASPDEMLALAAAIEQHSEHPLGRAIVRHAQTLGLKLREIDEFQALVGSGASARLDGMTAYVARPAFFWTQFGHNLAHLDSDLEGCLLQGKNVVMVGDERGVWGLIALRDRIRPSVKRTIGELRTLGVKRVVMLTGDNTRTAQTIASLAGIDEVDSELAPEQKVQRIVELAEEYGPVLMVGDGVNDAPALAAASVGVAMGAAGTDVALETADVALMADDLERLVDAFRLARRNQTVVRQNLALSTLVITGLVVGALSGWLSLTAAVIGHEISEFLVIASGLRMLRD
ncbi:MAG: heavy metal translocating P-type ATPase [Planctomycetaceae bacterium]|nr:heavy metal translocating P-type ATPase [Planctomycetaceae bacterium]